MNPKVKEKWLKALRSGEYKQGKYSLKKDRGGEVEYCCLGVLCDLAVKQGICKETDTHITTTGTNVEFDGRVDFLPESVQLWAQLSTDPVIVSKPGQIRPPEDYTALAYYNDELKYDFEKIADLIEVYL